jgi:hypothetical protein
LYFLFISIYILLDVPRNTLTAFMLAASAGIVWCGWIVVFGPVSRGIDWQIRNDRICKLLLIGGVLQTMLAGAAFSVARRPPDVDSCLIIIASGLVVITAALGPTVFSLLFRGEERFR